MAHKRGKRRHVIDQPEMILSYNRGTSAAKERDHVSSKVQKPDAPVDLEIILFGGNPKNGNSDKQETLKHNSTQSIELSIAKDDVETSHTLRHPVSPDIEEEVLRQMERLYRRNESSGSDEPVDYMDIF